jgi:futalosine hydrolase
MQLLLCASTEFEIRPVIDFIDSQNTTNITILITGVGMIATTYSLSKAIYQKRPDFIIQAGVGGCLDKRLPLSKVVFIENESLGDLGVEENASLIKIRSPGKMESCPTTSRHSDQLA